MNSIRELMNDCVVMAKAFVDTGKAVAKLALSDRFSNFKKGLYEHAKETRRRTPEVQDPS